jgi:WD40 repeat protein
LVIPRVAQPHPLASPFLPESPTRFWWMKQDRTRVLDAASGRETAGGFAHPEPITRLGFAAQRPPVRSDMKFLVVQVGQGWQAWELGPGGVIKVATLDGASNKVGVVKFSPRDDLVEVCFAGTGEVGVWHLRTGARAGPAFLYPTTLVYMTPNFSPDGRRLALGAADGAAMIIDVATARPVVTLATRHMVPNQGVLFSPDGTRVVTSSIRSETRVWDAATGEPISDILHTTDARGSVQYSPDGRWFATWGMNSANLWDGRTGAPIGETISAGGRMLRFSRDSRSLATASEDGTARVWDAPSGQPYTEPMRHGPERVGFPEFSPDGRFLRTETPNEYHLWSVPPRLPDGTPVPEWLLQLATSCATKTVNESGQLVDAPEALRQFDEVRRQIAASPGDDPLVAWGRWILDDRADRSLAPGFTLTPAEAARLAATLAGEIAVKP